jgi:predicted translin family RNA/ssDNA-binding protein
MKFFRQLHKDLAKQRSVREQTFAASRQAQQAAKLAIFAIHRDNPKEAEDFLKRSQEQLANLQHKFRKEPRFSHDGSHLAALEEFGEAWLTFAFSKNEKLSFPKKPVLPADQQIGALADFTGELVRRSVLAVTDGDRKTVDHAYKTVREVVNQLAKADLTGNLRQKFDDAKRNLKRLEEIRYDLKVRGR